MKLVVDFIHGRWVNNGVSGVVKNPIDSCCLYWLDVKSVYQFTLN